MNYRVLPFSTSQLYNFGNMNEASSSSSFPPQLADIIEDNKVNFYSNDFHLEPEAYNYYQQPDHRAIAEIPLIIDYQYAGADSNHGSIQQPLKKLSDWQCLQATENPRKRKNDGHDQKVVNKKLAHQERMQGIGQRVRERMPMRRSQKLADKITALQKLVSPYGKTDTASVLQEAHISINLLHDQIEELLQKAQTSTDNIQPAELWVKQNEGLRERGLCLVPASNPEINSLCFGNQNFNFLPGNY